MGTQIVGKIRLTLSPWTNQSWHVTLYVTSRGLTTSSIPHGSHTFEIQFDFIDQQLFIDKSDGARRTIPLKPQSVAEFYGTVMKTLGDLELPVTINTTPNEIENPIPFDQDEKHRSYHREYANRFWRVLVQSDRVARFIENANCGMPDYAFGDCLGAAGSKRSRGVPSGCCEICSVSLSTVVSNESNLPARMRNRRPNSSCDTVTDKSALASSEISLQIAR